MTTASYTWAELTGGSPVAPVEPRELLAIQWEADCDGANACGVDLTLDTIEFF